MSKFKHFIAVIALTIISTVGLYALFRFFLFRMPAQASREAVPIDQMADFHFMLQAFLFAVIMVIMLYAVYAFRRQPGDDSDGPHTHGHTGLEIIWTVIPTMAVVGFGIYGIVVLTDLLDERPGERTIEVVGQQWSWQFIYPDAGNKIGSELGLLVNEPVLLQMYARDVIHSFWVPEFRVKQDLLPIGNPEDEITYQPLRFTPTLEGTYIVRCAEMCGLQHSQMFATVRVMNQAAYDDWLETTVTGWISVDDIELLPDMSPEERGAFFYTYFGCSGCHALDDTPGLAGPTWQGLYGRERELSDGTTVIADDPYLYESILHPNARIVAGFFANTMPDNFEERFNQFVFGDADQTTNDLIAYIRSLNADEEAGAEAPAP